MKVHEAEVDKDIVVESYRKYPRRIATVLINFTVFTSWQRLLSVQDSARSK